MKNCGTNRDISSSLHHKSKYHRIESIFSENKNLEGLSLGGHHTNVKRGYNTERTK